MQASTATHCLSEVSASNDGRRCGRLPTAVAALLSMILMLAAARAQAAKIIVDSTADDTNAGHCTLREAINSANHGASSDTGSCRAGDGNDKITFRVRGTITLGSTLPDVVRTVTIQGPSSSRSDIMIDGGGNYRVMIGDSGATLNVANLTIKNGAVSGNGASGGGILNNGTLSVSNSALSANSVGGRTHTYGYGGGIANYGTLTVTDSIFSGNGKDFSYHCYGAGIANYMGTATVTNSTFSGNRTAYLAGGILNYMGTLTVANSTFSANTVGWPGHICTSGGGIYSYFGTLTVIDSSFSANSANIYGGGIDNLGGTATVTNSSFFGNGATGCSFAFGGLGGAIANLGPLVVTNSTFSANSAKISGGGIWSDATLTVTSSTFSANSANSGGGGIYNDTFQHRGVLDLKSTILANNTISGAGSPDNCDGKVTDIGYNISDDNSCGFAASSSSRNNTDPELDPAGLSDNGGPTQTIALQPNSPAIDVIRLDDCTDQASPPNRITTDQRGALRPDAGEVSCDIGAYEFQDFAGKANCHGQSVSALARQGGGLEAAAAAYGFPSVKALQAAIRTSCGG